MKNKGPMPRVIYDGASYALLSRRTIVPDLQSMDSLEARIWLMQNTRGKGYQIANSQSLPYISVKAAR